MEDHCLYRSVTAKTAEKAGLKVDIMAEEYTVDDLIAALEKHFTR